MKNLRILVILLAFLASFLIRSTVSAGVNDFEILSFNADYYLSKRDDSSSSLKVVETITAQFPNFNQNHGILRAIPMRYQDHTVSLEIESVKNQTGGWTYSTYTESDNLVLKIGDADKFVQGEQTYIITYTLANVINFQESGEEFYWDVNGDQWPQLFRAVTANIHVPSELVKQLKADRRCLRGLFGSTGEDCTILSSESSTETVISTSATDLNPYETLTFVIGFNKGTFVQGPEVAAERLKNKLMIIGVTSAIATPPLLTGVFIFRNWKKYGKDPKGRGVIIPEYQPPKGFNALMSGYILQETLENKAASALIVELATKHYLHIYEIKEKKIIRTETDYELELVKNPNDLSQAEQDVLKAFFGDELKVGKRVGLKSLKNKLHEEITKVGGHLSENLSQGGYFLENPKKVRNRYIIIGVALLVIGFALSFVLVGIGLVVSGLLLLAFSKAMPARTEKGVQIRDYLLGLRDYIKLAEQDRIKFLQSPEGAEKIAATGINPGDPKQKVKLFEKLLPYAMLFGLEKDWAKQFEGLYNQPPDWYSGNWNTFNTVYLASSLGGFSTASAASFTSPSSSSSSGFGGGGFSGGGGGGGGGGGW